jgi:predicted ATPase/signal transduction histidine kinase/DNA-binding NarL/FixJ family response regulator/tRNA A-37 threonylcarbamoyl transferase component Bud32
MDYILGDVLHVGSETRVVRGRHPKSGEEVVLKLPREQATASHTLERLRHEHAILRSLDVPGVIRTLGLEPHGQGLALVMEPWGDEPLGNALAKGPLPVGVALRLGAALARALEGVHRRSIIHRDIKPQNILTNAEHTDVRLIDFGTATRYKRTVKATVVVDALAGTLAYMAPEQTGRMNRAVDARADLYALGVTLYEMFTGTLPFETSDMLELIHAHIAKLPQPPHERARELGIPKAVSAIVLKLMANSPEHRYQTAGGAAFDLERAARQWAAERTVSPFELATHDWEDRVRNPSRLFGRERESAALEKTFEDARGGAVVLTLVAGPSGVGKSALVEALRGQVRRHNGIFAPGKFDQLQRSTPYSALAQALRSVVCRRLGDPAPVLEHWKQTWQEAVGPNGRILVDLMPQFVHIVGEPKPLVEVGLIEAKNRFQITVQRFVRTLATAEHPLVLFIDDLQWADPASLVMLQEIITGPDTGHILLVGAYRSDEVGPSHPLHGLVDVAKAKRVAVDVLSLSPLDDAALSSMVADMLDRPVTETEHLSRLVKEKTDGSPFFVGVFLHALHEQKLLSRSAETGRWQWQEEAIERAGITDNVAVLLTRRLKELPPALQGLLQTAACVGNRFDIELVGHLGGFGAEQLSSMLAEAADEGFLRQEDEDGQTYAFVHDRVQQAAYEARAASERLAAHLSIGRRLRARYGKACADDELFATLHHRNRTASILTSPEEKRDLAEQNLRAGQRAQTSTAYSEAAEFLRVGQALLGEAGWSEAAELTFETHLGLAEAVMLAGQVAEAEVLFQRCIDGARDPIERARVVSVWLPLLVVAGQFVRGAALALDALGWLGHPLPKTAEEHQALLGQTLEEIEPILQRTPVASWKATPNSDPTHQHVCKILDTLTTCAAFAQPSLSPCCPLLVVRETLHYGIAKSSASAFAFTALFLTYAAGKLSAARWLMDAAVALVEQYNVPRTDTLHFVATASQFLVPLPQAIANFLRAGETGAQEGIISHGEYGKLHAHYAMALEGRYLPGVLSSICAQSYRDRTAAEIRVIFEQITDLLMRHPSSDTEPGAVGHALDQATHHARSSLMMDFYAGAMACWAGLHLGMDLWAARKAIALEPHWGVSWGTPPLLAFTWTLCVATVHCLPEASVEERSIWEEKLAFHVPRLAQWEESCPETFRHVRLLMEAGRARLAGKHDEAERLYEEAVEDARKNGFGTGEALGLRLAGEHRLALGKVSYARACLREAHDAYVRWGAPAAAACLKERHPELMLAVRESATPATKTTSHNLTTTTSGGRLAPHLDVAAVLRAAQALSSDKDLGSLVGRMLRLLAESAGAERAVLALAHAGVLSVRAQLTVEPEQLELDLNEPVDDSARLPVTLVQYVARGNEPVVLGQAISDSRFDDDAYLRTHHPASVLAVPLVHQGRLSGVMYLEHHRVADAFPEARVGLVTLLASQAATAVENATMYTALATSHERLELEVQARTVELKKAKEAADTANRAKSGFLASMSHELRTPLNSILGYAHILERMPELSAKGQDYVRIINTSGEHLLMLISDLLDLAKIEAGRMELVYGDVHFPTFIHNVYSICRVRAEQKDLSFAHEHVGPELADVRVDERRLVQVLLNLLGNAIKFTQQGGVLLRTITLEDSPPGKPTVRLEIKDTGPGIEAEHLTSIFEPFEQVGDLKTRREGTGLGLAISRKIVEQMGGSIHVESELGKGSVFTVTLCLPEASALVGAAGAASSRTDIDGYKGERRKILIVDDSRENRGVLHNLLTPCGFEVIEAESGEQALKLAVEQMPALIVMDLAMPGMDGYETTRRLRQEPTLAKTVIIASSASASEVERSKSVSAGCDGFLSKPLQVTGLFDTLQQHLGLEWIFRTRPGEAASPPPAAVENSALMPPPAAIVASLLALSRRGRLVNLLEELGRVEQRDPRLGPWVTTVRSMVKSFQIERLHDFLLAHAREDGHHGPA